MNKETLKKYVIRFVRDSLDEHSVYFEVSDGQFDEDAEYTCKTSLIFQVNYFRRHDDTPCSLELVHVVQKKKGYQLIKASPRNMYPSKEDCLDYQFLNVEED